MEISAAPKCVVSNIGEVPAYDDFGQSRAIRESPISNGGHFVRGAIASNLSSRVLDQNGEVLIKEHTVNAAVGRIGSVHCDGAQTGAVTECDIPDVNDGAGEAQVCQAGAAIKGPRADASNALRNRNVDQFSTSIKSPAVDVCDRRR